MMIYNDLMSVLLVLFFVLAVLVLLMMLGLIAFKVYLEYESYKKSKETEVAMPDNSFVDHSIVKSDFVKIPLDQFVPDFKKPLKVKLTEEGDQTIMEEE